MRIEGIIWIDEIIEKLLKKLHILQDEVREIFNNKSHFRFVEKGHRPGENVYAPWERPMLVGTSLSFLF